MSEKQDSASVDSRTVYIGNLPFSTREEEIRELFAVFGRVVEIKSLNRTNSNQFGGVMFVIMETESIAKTAVEGLNKTLFGGRTLKVSIAERRSSDKSKARDTMRYPDSKPNYDRHPSSRPRDPYYRDNYPPEPRDKYYRNPRDEPRRYEKPPNSVPNDYYDYRNQAVSPRKYTDEPYDAYSSTYPPKMAPVDPRYDRQDMYDQYQHYSRHDNYDRGARDQVYREEPRMPYYKRYEQKEREEQWPPRQDMDEFRQMLPPSTDYHYSNYPTPPSYNREYR